jgi:hypothetical protein
MKMPKKLGDLIDLGRELEQQRREYQREVDEKIDGMKKNEAAVEAAVLSALEKAGVEKASGSSATATLNKNATPTIKDFALAWKWIKTNDAHELIRRQFNSGAYSERLAAGESIPGVETFWKKTISYSKFNSSK